jgi:hypothetical protein
MADGASDDPEMPDQMVIWNPFYRVEYNAHHISDPPSQNPESPFRGHMLPKGTNCEQSNPAQPDVEPRRETTIFEAAKNFESDTEQSQGPDHQKKGPSPDSSQRSESERRVRSGDQNEYGRVIEQAEHPLHAVARKRMINRRRHIGDNHADREDDHPDQTPFASPSQCRGNEKWYPGNNRHQGQGSTQTVGQFFARGLNSLLVRALDLHGRIYRLIHPFMHAENCDSVGSESS